MRLNDRLLEPPDGWTWLVPETRWPAKGFSFANLVEVVRKHYAGNGFTYGTALAARVEDGLCQALCEKRHFAYVRHPELPIEDFIGPMQQPAGVPVDPFTIPKIKKLLSHL